MPLRGISWPSTHARVGCDSMVTTDTHQSLGFPCVIFDPSVGSDPICEADESTSRRFNRRPGVGVCRRTCVKASPMYTLHVPVREKSTETMIQRASILKPMSIVCHATRKFVLGVVAWNHPDPIRPNTERPRTTAPSCSWSRRSSYLPMSVGPQVGLLVACD